LSGGAILLLGVHGQVGGEALPLLRGIGEVVSLTRAELDLRDAGAIREAVRNLRPRWIVNAAGYTAVDKAESDAQTARAINGDAPGILGEEAARIGSAVIHFSTEYVFSGAGIRPWREEDPTGPLGVYGASKLAGERALAESGAVHFIFRTSWVFGTRGENFLLRILQLAQQREELKIVDDQVGSPTWSRSLARLTEHTIRKIEQRAASEGASLDEVVRPVGGIYHACSMEFTTWFGFASEFLGIAQKALPEETLARLLPIPSSAYPRAAERPKNSRLNCERLERELKFKMPSWQSATNDVMEELLEEMQKSGTRD
jgi:dTDP-4-dehydrorhamnose reductase